LVVVIEKILAIQSILPTPLRPIKSITKYPHAEVNYGIKISHNISITI
jgi:hypothetical protein